MLLLSAGCVKQPASISPSTTGTVPPANTFQSTPSTTPEAASLKVVGQIGGPIQAVAVSGNYAYVGVGLRLEILDISNPAVPSEVGATEPFGYYVEDVSVIGNIAFVAAGGSGLYTIDVSDPTRPTVVGNFDSAGYTEGVTVVGKYAYLADGPAGLRVIDITDRAHPIEVASAYRLNYIFDIAIEGKYAYLAAAGAGLLVADLTDPTKPNEIGALDTPGYSYGVTVSGTIACVADGWGGLRIADVTDPAQPKEIGGFDTRGWALDVAVDGTTAYVAGATYGLRVMDISDKTKPTEIGSYEISGGNAIKLAFNREAIYLADRATGLHVINVSVPANLAQTGLYSPMGYADAVAVSGNYAYVAGGPYGLRVTDISDLSHPKEIASLEIAAYATSIAVAGNYVYVGNISSSELSSGLHTVDISDPTNPRETSFLPIHGQPQDLVLKGTILYIADEFGLQLFDLSNPASPIQVGAIDFAQGDEAKAVIATWGVAVSDDKAYLTHGDRLEVLDVSNPKKPTVIGFYSKPNSIKSGAVTIGGNFAYVNMPPGLEVVDISNPKTPSGAGSLNLPVGPQRFTFSNDTLYIADSGAGLLALDVSNPRRPIQVGLQRLPGSAIGLNTAGDNIYVADGEGGLFIVQDIRKQSGSQQTSSAQSGESDGGSQDIVARDDSLVSVEKTANNPKPDGSKGDSVNKSTVAFNSGHTITVNNPADSGHGTLRWALETASRGDTITFDPAVFPPKAPVSIRVTSGLFLSQGGLTIDASYAGVILDGSGTSKSDVGLGIDSDYNIVKGLQILNFPGNGLSIRGANNIIGGDRTRGDGLLGEGNLISGNGYAGVMIMGGAKGGEVFEPVGNLVRGNYIGTDLTGTRIVGNQVYGVFLSGSGARNNVIGGATEAERNVISGNAAKEVTLQSQANGNRVVGNYIGTDTTGRISLGNAALASVSVELGGFNNIIERNVISNKDHIGVIISDWGSWYNQVIGNYVGVDATGSLSFGGKGAGIHVNQSFNKVGGTTPEERNIIGGNSGQGIKIGMESVLDVIVIGNYVGLDVTGTKPIGNGIGVSIGEGTHHTFVGGSTHNERNVVSGNSGVGVLVEGLGTDCNFVIGNFVGTDVRGSIAIPNQGNGIEINAGDNTFVQKNLIAYNGNAGVTVKPGNSNQINHNSLTNNGKGNGIDGGNNNRWDDGKQGNYWNDYNGQDKNSDGIGDTPYQIKPNGVDKYPLMKPYGM